jgi:hypothetical protein
MAHGRATVDLSSDEGGGKITRATMGRPRASPAETRTSQLSPSRAIGTIVHGSQELRNVESRMRSVPKRSNRRDRQNGDDQNMRGILSNGYSPSRGTSRDRPVDVDGEKDVYSPLVSALAAVEPARRHNVLSRPAPAERKKRPPSDSSTSRYFPAVKSQHVQQVDLTSDDEVEYLPEAMTKTALSSSILKSKAADAQEDPHGDNISLNQRYAHERRRAGSQDVNDYSIDELAPAQNSFQPSTRRKVPTPNALYELPDSENEREESRSRDIPSQFPTPRNAAVTQKSQLAAYRPTKKLSSITWTLAKYTAIAGVLEHVLARIEDQSSMAFFAERNAKALDSKYNIKLKAVTKIQWSAKSNLVRVVAPGRRAWDLTFDNAEEARTFVVTAQDNFSTDISEMTAYVAVMHPTLLLH